MRKSGIILNIVLFSILCTTAKASECVFSIFQEEKINLALCQNYSAYQETYTLLFKARTKVLNDLIKDKIARGKLQDKKFEIQIYDPILARPYFELTQGKNGYYVTMVGGVSLEKLVAIVDYFSKSDWKPFIAKYNEDENSETTVWQRENNFYKSNIRDELFAYNPFIVWERDGVSLVYSDDKLKYAINGTTVPFKVNATLPVKIQDRYLFFLYE